MNNKEFITRLAEEMQLTAKETQRLTDAFIELFKSELQEGNTIAVQSFGNFDIKKKNERIVINPSTKQRMLVPPKLVLNFKPSTILKDKFNETTV